MVLARVAGAMRIIVGVLAEGVAAREGLVTS